MIPKAGDALGSEPFLHGEGDETAMERDAGCPEQITCCVLAKSPTGNGDAAC